MKEAGLNPDFRGWLPGFDKIMRFKMLKSLSIVFYWFERLLPFNSLSRFVDAHLGLLPYRCW